MRGGLIAILVVAGVFVGIALALRALGLRHAHAWIRYSLVVSLILLGLFSLTTKLWPEGLGVELCEQVLSGDPPVLREVCNRPAPDNLLVIFGFLLLVLLLAPDISEFSLPGLLALKTRVEKQSAELARLSSALASSSSVATASSVSDVRTQINVGVDRYIQGRDPGLAGLAALEVAWIALQGIYAQERDGSGVLAGCEFRTYELGVGGVLRPLGEGFQEVDTFRPGLGATGQAWSNRETIVVFGPEVSNEQYGLTPEQQEHFKSLTGVGAAPIMDFTYTNVLGVLTVTTTADHAPEQWDQLKAEWKQRLEPVAAKAAVVLGGILNPS